MGVVLGARALLSIGTPQLWWWEPQDSKWILSNLNILSCQNGHNLTLGGRLTLCLRACVRVRSVGTGRAGVRAVGCGSTRNTHTLPPPPPAIYPPHTRPHTLKPLTPSQGVHVNEQLISITTHITPRPSQGFLQGDSAFLVT